MIWFWWRHDVAYWYILYDGFTWWWDVMRTRWWFRNITGSYRRTCYRGRIWEDYDSLYRGCLGDISSRRVVGVFSWYITHSRHTQVNTSVDTVYGILWFSWYKIYMYYVLKSICIIKETLVVSDFVLARRCSEKIFWLPWVLKKRLIHRYRFFYDLIHDFFMLICVYIYIFTLIL